VTLLVLAGRGGEENERFIVVACGFGGGRGSFDTARSWSSSSATCVRLPTQSAGGQQLQALTLEMRQVFTNLHRRPCRGLAAAPHFLPAPSGFVPGAGEEGRCLRPVCLGGVEGPDCFLDLWFRVFSVNVQDCFLIAVIFEVLAVICIAPLIL
jgi:hypothetical protein